MFWAGVFYVLTSLDSSHIHVLARSSFIGFFARDQYLGKTISTYVYIILIFLALLFYGNICWILPRVIRYKKGIVRLALFSGWFMVVFAANYLIAGPFFNQDNPTPEQVPAHFTPNRDIRLKAITIDDAPPHPPEDAISFIIRDWLHIQPVILLAFLVIEGIAIAYFFLKEWSRGELIHAQLQANHLNTEIKFLKSQINPHFLFNTLNNLFSMAQDKENDELADGISKLSGMMRYMLYDSNEESVPLSKEITYLRQCITLNKLRYAADEVVVTFDHPRTAADINIAPMLFIPFVENAFKYGVAIGQRAEIQIAIIVSDEKMYFNCVNTDFSFIKKMDMEISGIGLENVKRRLELVYPRKHRLNINKEDGKFSVKLEIDLS
jgi:hypothetical protein